ncbi:MAG: hypothetical protein JRJ77_04045 [Deltaproteobacteria bacterium]|nr:hypothetical protein [Deltaproteobacteria bacterium]MBW2341523.1 hypothetical protein [Deltaproteobacteria bacterium]
MKVLAYSLPCLAWARLKRALCRFQVNVTHYCDQKLNGSELLRQGGNVVVGSDRSLIV